MGCAGVDISSAFGSNLLSGSTRPSSRAPLAPLGAAAASRLPSEGAGIESKSVRQKLRPVTASSSCPGLRTDDEGGAGREVLVPEVREGARRRL